VKLHARVMENTLAYRVWQAPFAEQKLAPLYAHNDLGRVRRVLDVGCGPGTNTQHFAHADYLGIDFNPAYIESARRRHGREFVVADVTKYEVPREERFDLILANSLFHHIDTANTARILAHLAALLSDDGHVHVSVVRQQRGRPSHAFSPARIAASIRVRWRNGGRCSPAPSSRWCSSRTRWARGE